MKIVISKKVKKELYAVLWGVYFGLLGSLAIAGYRQFGIWGIFVYPSLIVLTEIGALWMVEELPKFFDFLHKHIQIEIEDC
jgi:hypothetical protein